MREFFFDTESDGLYDEATHFWCAAGRVREEGDAQSWILYDGGVPAPGVPEQWPAFLEELDKADVLIGHNIVAHDLPLLKKLIGWEPRPDQKIVDTLLMSRLLQPDRVKPPFSRGPGGPHSLAMWGYRVGRGKVAHEEWHKFSDNMIHRCVEDTEILVLTYDALLREGQGRGWGPAIRLTNRLFPLLFEQEQNGMLVDWDFVHDCRDQLTRWRDRIDRVVEPHLPVVIEKLEKPTEEGYTYVKTPFKKNGELTVHSQRWLDHYNATLWDDCANRARRVDIAGPYSRVHLRRVNLQSNPEVKDFLLDLGWIPAEWNTNNKKERTSPKLSQHDPFDGIQGSLGKLIARRVQINHRLSTINGWIRDRRPDDRLPGGIAGMAVTGRMRHRTIVNVPGKDKFYGPKMRAMFIAPKGRVLVGTDSVANQIRQLANRMGDDEWTEVVLNPDIDMHSYHQERGGISLRSAAKIFFYALIFGAGDAKLARDLRETLAYAKKLRADFMGGMPKLAQLLARLESEWKRSGGWITGADGRPIKVPALHQLLVYLLQSDEAIQMSLAYCLAYERLSIAFDKSRWMFVLWMHDEFQVECDEEIADTVGQVCCWAIKEAAIQLGFKVPHEGEYKIGKNWWETH